MSSPLGYADFKVPPPPPPLPVSKFWWWAAVAFVIGTVIAISVSFVTFVAFSETDITNSIDDGDILAVIEHECATMTRTVDGIMITGTLKQQAAAITKQDEAIQKMIDAVRALDPHLLRSDEPTLKWTYDWAQLINLRSLFAAELERGKNPEFEEPVSSDGEPILDRMDYASDPYCVVPDALLNPYPEEVDEI